MEKYVQKIEYPYGQECQVVKYQQPQLFKGISKKSSSTVRNQIADKLNAFLKLDKINYTNLKESLLNNKKDILWPAVAFLDENILTVQSSKFVDGIPVFMLGIYNNLHFETFHYGVKCYISSLSKNHINTVGTWSKLEEIIWYLNFMAFDHKKIILS